MRDKFIALTKKQKIVLLSLSFLLIAVLITIAGIYDSLNLFPRAKSSVTPISIQEPTVLQKTAVTVDQQITNSVSSVKIEGAKPKTKALVYLQKYQALQPNWYLAFANQHCDGYHSILFPS